MSKLSTHFVVREKFIDIIVEKINENMEREVVYNICYLELKKLSRYYIYPENLNDFIDNIMVRFINFA